MWAPTSWPRCCCSTRRPRSSTAWTTWTRGRAASPACEPETPSRAFLSWLRATPPTEVAQHYVQTFDLRRRCALYLTYYRYGDTRKRGMAMLRFKAAYRGARFAPSDDGAARLPADGARVRRARPAGVALLRSCRADLELLRRALDEAESPYAHVVDAVCAAAAQAAAAGSSARCASTGRPAPRTRTSAWNRSRPPEYLTGYGRPAARRRHDEHAPLGDTSGGWSLPYVALAIFVRRAHLALALRPVRLDQPLHPVAGTAQAASGAARCSTTARSPRSPGTSSAS